eukprot:gene4922-9817_t
MVDPAFVMHWAEDIPKYTSEDGLSKITIWAGSLFGKNGLTPTPNSWAAEPQNEVGVWHITLSPGARITLPAAVGGKSINRMAYFIEGEHLSLGDESLKGHSAVTLDASQGADLFNSHESTTTELLILQGRPIAEKVVQHGPFVMNSDNEIQQAFADYRRTQFGGWPWPQDAMVFPKEKGRFALQSGVEYNPPSK